MAESNRELDVSTTRATDHELSSVGFTIADGAIPSDDARATDRRSCVVVLLAA